MNTDFTSEFNKLFSRSCNVSTDWNKPRFFDPQSNDCYAGEVALMSSLTSEAYGKYGFEVTYYIKDINTKLDVIMGEDQLENVVRRFKLKVYAENIPSLQKTYQLQGMVYSEIITVQCTILHFEEASQTEYNTNEIKYDSTVPKIGDIMYFNFNDTYYEVLNVKSFAENSSFLGSPITYTFNLRVWRNSHEYVDKNNYNDDKMEDIRSYIELGETFNIKNDYDTKKSEVKAEGDILAVNDYLEKPEQTQVLFRNEEDPFGGW